MSVLTTLHAPTHYLHTCPHRLRALHMPTHYIIIIIDHFCIALFSGVPRLTALNSLHTHRLHAHTHYMPTQTTYTQRLMLTHYHMPTDYMHTQTTYTQRLHAHTDYIHTQTHAHTLPHADRLHAHTYYMPPHTTCPQTTCPHRHCTSTCEGKCVHATVQTESECLSAITADTELVLAEFATLPSHLSHYTFCPALTTPTALC